MRFPSSKRVVFGANPLAEVICQLKFPRLLEIDQELPVDFHRHIRDQFPEIATRSTVELMIDAEPGSSPTPLLRPMYDFVDPDANRRITRGDFVALTFGRYEDWKRFRQTTRYMREALTHAYDVKYSTRVGLRYRNVIDRANLGLETTSWKELIRPEILGLATADVIDEADLSELSCVYAGTTKQESFRINVGLVKTVDSKVTGFIIDTAYPARTR